MVSRQELSTGLWFAVSRWLLHATTGPSTRVRWGTARRADQEEQREGEEDKMVAGLWFAVSGFTASTPSSPIDSSQLMMIICMYESE